MPTIHYSSDFKEALEVATEKKLFLGTGNPNAQIVIVGKEAAINRNEEQGQLQYAREYGNNIKDWKKNVDESIQSESIGFAYNPLYPYKGQFNKLYRSIKQTKEGNHGTSKTWCCYQRIIDYVYHNQLKSSHIIFHEHVFTSELSQESAKYSNQTNSQKTRDSIALRKELFATSFFRAFPITIVAVGHYVRDYQINLEELFEVTYDSNASAKASTGLKNEYLNMHYDDLNNPKRLLIHTNQLSMVSNALLERIGEVCKNFLNT